MAPPKGMKKPNMTLGDRKAAFLGLLMHVEDGALKQGAYLAVANKIGRAKNSLHLLWKNTLAKMKAHLITINEKIVDAIAAGATEEEQDKLLSNPLLEECVDESQKLNIHIHLWPEEVFSANLKGVVGRKRTLEREALKNKAREIHLNKRRTIRSMAKELGVSRTFVWNAIKNEGLFRRHVSKVKPILTEANKMARVVYALSQIDPNSVPDRNGAENVGRTRASSVPKVPVFRDQMDTIHIDEKWFFLCQARARYILVEDKDSPELDPVRRVRHKSHITKVMFLCAQARPRWDYSKNQMWDGKIGIWPVGQWQPYVRGEKARQGLMKWVDVKLTRQKYTELLIEKLLPSIEAKWPKADWRKNGFQVTIQQDGAGAHIDTDKESKKELDSSAWNAAVAAMADKGMKVRLVTQPPNSPDCNLNDLGFFAALQALYYNEAPNDTKELIGMVMKAYEDFQSEKINRIWLTYMSCLNQIIECHGDNDYAIPHLKKTKIGCLPKTLRVTDIFLETFREEYEFSSEIEAMLLEEDIEEEERTAIVGV
jgi:hypothetical protein